MSRKRSPITQKPTPKPRVATSPRARDEDDEILEELVIRPSEENAKTEFNNQAHLIHEHVSCDVPRMEAERERKEPRQRRLEKEAFPKREHVTAEGLTTAAPDRPTLDVEKLFADSELAVKTARGTFQGELEKLANQGLSHDSLRTVVAVISRRCEDLSLVLRMEDGRHSTIRFDDKSGQVEVTPLRDPKDITQIERLPLLSVVPISELSGHEASVALGRMLGLRQSAVLTLEQRSHGGKISASRLTSEERSRRASKAAKTQSESMTPEERKERASNAAKTMHARRRASNSE